MTRWSTKWSDNRAEINYKAGSNVVPGGKYPEIRLSRNKVSKEILFLQFFVFYFLNALT